MICEVGQRKGKWVGPESSVGAVIVLDNLYSPWEKPPLGFSEIFYCDFRGTLTLGQEGRYGGNLPFIQYSMVPEAINPSNKYKP